MEELRGSTSSAVTTAFEFAPARPNTFQDSPASREPKMCPSVVPRYMILGSRGSTASARTSPPVSPADRQTCAEAGDASRSASTAHAPIQKFSSVEVRVTIRLISNFARVNPGRFTARNEGSSCYRRLRNAALRYLQIAQAGSLPDGETMQKQSRMLDPNASNGRVAALSPGSGTLANRMPHRGQR